MAARTVQIRSDDYYINQIAEPKKGGDSDKDFNNYSPEKAPPTITRILGDKSSQRVFRTISR